MLRKMSRVRVVVGKDFRSVKGFRQSANRVRESGSSQEQGRCLMGNSDSRTTFVKTGSAPGRPVVTSVAEVSEKNRMFGRQCRIRGKPVDAFQVRKRAMYNICLFVPNSAGS